MAGILAREAGRPSRFCNKDIVARRKLGATYGRVSPAIETFDESPQLELNPSPNQCFTGLHCEVCIIKQSVHALLLEHCNDDGPCDLP